MLETSREGLRSLSGTSTTGTAAAPRLNYDDSNQTTPEYGLQSPLSTSVIIDLLVVCVKNDSSGSTKIRMFSRRRVYERRRRRESVLNVSGDR
jgi:hypothetical protein